MFATDVGRDGAWTLLRNKLRSSLTVLGITIGIGAVICVVSIGLPRPQGFQLDPIKALRCE